MNAPLTSVHHKQFGTLDAKGLEANFRAVDAQTVQAEAQPVVEEVRRIFTRQNCDRDGARS